MNLKQTKVTHLDYEKFRKNTNKQNLNLKSFTFTHTKNFRGKTEDEKITTRVNTMISLSLC